MQLFQSTGFLWRGCCRSILSHFCLQLRQIVIAGSGVAPGTPESILLLLALIGAVRRGGGDGTVQAQNSQAQLSVEIRRNNYRSSCRYPCCILAESVGYGFIPGKLRNA